jgi:hypothetical protein
LLSKTQQSAVFSVTLRYLKNVCGLELRRLKRIVT